MKTWATAYAINAGSGKETVQDACAVRDDGGRLAIAVSDGAGSSPCSDIGANVVARMFTEQSPEELPEGDATAWAIGIVERIALGIKAVAEKEERPIGDFSATLVGAISCPNRTVFVQVGDGIAVCRRTDAFELAVEPEASEFVNSTFFVTDANVAEHVRVRDIVGPVEEIALLTDGLQPLVLYPGDHQPHDRFFETVFRNLRAESGHDDPASAWLAEMLASDLVTRRTDDDTSIVIAKRAAVRPSDIPMREPESSSAADVQPSAEAAGAENPTQVSQPTDAHR